MSENQRSLCAVAVDTCSWTCQSADVWHV